MRCCHYHRRRRCCHHCRRHLRGETPPTTDPGGSGGDGGGGGGGGGTEDRTQQVEETEAACNAVNLELLQLTADLDGMKMDVEMHKVRRLPLHPPCLALHPMRSPP